MKNNGLIGRFINWFPVALTANEELQRQITKLMLRTCAPAGTFVDVGAYKGFFLNVAIDISPQATHIAFEPLPKKFTQLVRKFSSAVRIYKKAITDETGIAPFYHTLEKSSYSGLKKLTYPAKFHLEKIEVETDTIDNVIHDARPALIKITVQGAELKVIKGAEHTINSFKPLILLKPDNSNLDSFHTSPEALYDYLAKYHQYQIFTLKTYLEQGKPLLRQEFSDKMDDEKKLWYVAAVQPPKTAKAEKRR